MPTMQDVRAKFPQYDDMSDADLANGLYRKFYSDMPRADFDAKLGLGGAPTAQPDKFGGAAMNATAGANEGLYGIAGLPVDAMRGAMNLGIRGFNAVTGSDVGQIPDNSFGGSRYIGETMGKIRPELDPANTVAETTGDRLARATGQGAAYAVAPVGVIGGASRAGIIGPQAEATAAKLLGGAGSTGEVVGNAVVGATSGFGSQAAIEAAPEALGPYAGFVGGVVGGGLGALTTTIPGLAGQGLGAVRRAVEPFSEAGRERMAGRILERNASGPRAVVDAIETQPAELVPGSLPTTFQQTGDLGLGSLERGYAAKFPARFAERRADQNTARVAALDGIQPGGAPEQVAQSVRSYLQQLDDDGAAALAEATGRARTSAEGLGAGMQADDAGAAMRASIEAARAPVKARERALWDAVDPQGNMTVPFSSTRQGLQGVMAEMTPFAQPISETERQIYGAIQGAGEAIPLRSMRDLQSNLKAAMRAERSTNGESPAYRRMSIVSDGIVRDFDGAISSRVAQEAQAVAAGRMRGEDTFAANFARAQEEWLASRSAGAVSATGTAGGNGARGIGANGSSGSRAVPGVAGAEGQAGRRLPNSPSNPGLPEDGGIPFDRAAQERLTAATTATRERAQTFDNPVLAPMRRKSATELPNATVARRIFSASPDSFEAIQTYRRAVGDAEASTSLMPYAVGQAKRAAMNEDGTFDAARLDRWRRQHADALRAFPDLDARLGDAGRAAEAVGEATAMRRQQMDAAQKGALGKFVGVDSPEEVMRIVGGYLGRQDGARQLAQLRQAVGNDPEAVEGLRKAAADFITNRLIGNTEVATSGQAGIKSDQFQSFIRQNEPALRTIFSPEEITSMQAVAADLQRANRSVVAVKNPGTPGTAQDLIAAENGENRISALGKAIGMFGGTFGAGAGSPLGAVAGGSAWLASMMRENGIRKVDELVTDALLNPDRARILLSRIGRNPEAQEAGIARRYRQSVAISGAMSLDGEEDPSQRALDLMRAGPRSELPQTPREKLAAIMVEKGISLDKQPSPGVRAVANALDEGRRRRSARAA